MKKKFVKLYENAEIQQKSELNTVGEENVLLNKSKQFKFDCGLVMGKINVPINTKFGLYHHSQETKDLESFIKSVSDFISSTDNRLTDNDITKLSNDYVAFNHL